MAFSPEEPALRSDLLRPDHDMEEMKRRGFFFPAEWIPPVLTMPERLDAPGEFHGTATLIGRDLFLSARHVLEAAAAVPGHQLCLPKLVVHDERLELVITPVAEWEPHPDPACDLCIGRFTEWDAVCPFAGFGYGSALDDVVCVGYPGDSIAALQSLDFAAALNRPRYVKGYISRGIDTDNDPAFGQPCFELSFGISPGMSGSPVWGHVPDPSSGERPVRV